MTKILLIGYSGLVKRRIISSLIRKNIPMILLLDQKNKKITKLKIGITDIQMQSIIRMQK